MAPTSEARLTRRDEIAELLPLLDRDTDQLPDDRHREPEGQDGHEVDLAGFGHRVEHRVEQGDDALLEAGHPAGSEGPADHAPQAGVLRRILHEHGHLHAAHEPLGQGRVLPVAADHPRAAPRPGIDQDRLAVVVARGVPVAVELAAEQGGDVAQRPVQEIGVLPALLGAEQHVEDLVGRVTRRGHCHGLHLNRKVALDATALSWVGLPPCTSPPPKWAPVRPSS